MRLLVSGATATLRRHSRTPYLGALIVPGAGNRLDPILAAGLPWAADNAAFTGFDPAAFCAMLGRIAAKSGCRFVACPDVVGDAAATAERFRTWAPIVAALDLPPALVLQDGQERVGIPWDQIAGVFVGGTTEFKLGPLAASLIREAKSRGKWVHLGRCNTRGRFRHAYQLTCDSVDGSGFSRWPDQRIPLALSWLQELHGGQPAAPLDSTAREFFRGGRVGGLVEGSGWSVGAVWEEAGCFVVEARFRSEPQACPVCARIAPDTTRLLGHGTRTVTVVDRDRHSRPVRVLLTRQRYRCGACGHVFTPEPPGLVPGSRLTTAALQSIESDMTGHAAKRLGVAGRTVRRARVRLPLMAPTSSAE